MHASLPFALAAAFVLVGCKQQAESFNDTIVDPQAAALANAAPVVAPPMIKSSHSYRCKDNSLIYVDFMTDGTTANFKAEKSGPLTTLKAPEAGQPFVSEDGSKTITGSENEITYNGQSCKAG
ncbi:MAG TPA: hypothetical protein VFF89_10795 [Sphingobium sp.]|nr:hypothetical protein [Sphingobium sp.]